MFPRHDRCLCRKVLTWAALHFTVVGIYHFNVLLKVRQQSETVLKNHIIHGTRGLITNWRWRRYEGKTLRVPYAKSVHSLWVLLVFSENELSLSLGMKKNRK